MGAVTRVPSGVERETSHDRDIVRLMKWRTALALRLVREEVEAYSAAHESAMVQLVEEFNRQMVESARHNRDIIAQFLIVLDEPETHDELRETLHEALMDLSDHVARLEEHVG